MIVDWLRSVFAHERRDPAPPNGSSTDELREAKALREENRRHVAAIERHVSAVSQRVRAEAAEGDRRVRG